MSVSRVAGQSRIALERRSSLLFTDQMNDGRLDGIDLFPWDEQITSFMGKKEENKLSEPIYAIFLEAVDCNFVGE